MAWRRVVRAAVLLLLLAWSAAATLAAPAESGACLLAMARLQSVRWWCLQPRLPGHIVNSVRACLQRGEFSREATGARTGRDQLLVGFSSKYVPGALNSSRWTSCHAGDGGWTEDPKAYFGTVTLEGEDSGQHEYRLWYAADSRYQCWERTYKKFLPRVDAKQHIAEPYLYECGRCTFDDTDGDSDEEEEEEEDKTYSYIWGFDSTLYRRRKCATSKLPYLPALQRVRRPAASCAECLLWTELRAAPTAYLGRCWGSGGRPSRGNRARLCSSDGAVRYWQEVDAAKLASQPPDVIPLPAVGVRQSPEAAESVQLQEALAALHPRNFQPGVVRTGGPAPQTLISCLDTVLAESSSISQAQISQSLKGFEMFVATVALDGAARSSRRLTVRGQRATLLVAERARGAIVSAGRQEVAAIDAQQDGGSAAALSSRGDVRAAVVSAAAAAGRLAVTFFHSAGVGAAFHQPGYQLNSDVLSVQIINGSSEAGLLVDVVLRPARGGVRRRCAMWDLEASAWDFSLCTLHLQGQVSDVCRCRHLTHLGQLVTDADVRWGAHARPLELLSLAGVCASLLGAAGLAAAAAADRQWRAKPGSRVLLQLGGAVAARDLLFALVTAGGQGWWQPRATAGCVALGVLLHYALLAAAAWTTAAAVLQLLRLTTVAGPQARVPHVVLVCSACSWLWPLAAVAALLSAAGPAAYPLRDDSASDFLCYPQGTAFYAAVLLPTAACLLANAAIFLYLLFTVLFPPCSAGSGVVVTRHGPSQLRRRALTAAMLFFLLGLPWVLGPPARVPALAYLFCVVATPQGLVLFVFFVLCNSELRKRLSSTVMTSLATSSSWRSSSERKQRQRQRSAGAAPATSSSAVAAAASSSTEGHVRHRRSSSPEQAPAVQLTRYALVGEDGEVRHTFDLASWAPDAGPADAAYVPSSPERRSVTKYVFPEPESDREADQ